MNRWNLKKLGQFVRVAKAPSLSAAARDLGMSQSALTQAVRGLEGDLGFVLFDREHGFQLTGLGRELLPRAEAALARIEELSEEMAGIVDGKVGSLRIGCGPAVAEGLLGPVLGRLLASCPRAVVDVRIGRFPEFAGLLRSRGIDLLIGEASGLAGDPELVIEPLPADEIVLFCRAGHPLAGRRRVSRREFFSYAHVATDLPPWVLVWLSSIRPSRSTHPGLSLTSGQYALLIRVVETSDALSGAPRSVIEPALAAGRLAPVHLASPPISNQASIVYLKERGLSPLAQRLVRELAGYGSCRTTIRNDP